MEQITSAELDEVCSGLMAYHLPRWQELPDLDLYMDQVLSLVSRYLSAYPGYDGKGLTASMVNNYVKLGVMPPPTRKKYTRTHLAYLMVICLTKAVLPISLIQQAIVTELNGQTEESFYNSFCDLLEASCRTTAEKYRTDSTKQSMSVLWQASLHAQAEQALALRIASPNSGKS